MFGEKNSLSDVLTACLQQIVLSVDVQSWHDIQGCNSSDQTNRSTKFWNFNVPSYYRTADANCPVSFFRK